MRIYATQPLNMTPSIYSMRNTHVVDRDWSCGRHDTIDLELLVFPLVSLTTFAGIYCIGRYYLQKDCCHQSLESTCIDLDHRIVEIKCWVIVNIRMSSGQYIIWAPRVRAYIKVGSVTLSDATITESIYVCINLRYNWQWIACRNIWKDHGQ